jgi:hypothetical protein
MRRGPGWLNRYGHWFGVHLSDQTLRNESPKHGKRKTTSGSWLARRVS